LDANHVARPAIDIDTDIIAAAIRTLDYEPGSCPSDVIDVTEAFAPGDSHCLTFTDLTPIGAFLIRFPQPDTVWSDNDGLCKCLRCGSDGDESSRSDNQQFFQHDYIPCSSFECSAHSVYQRSICGGGSFVVLTKPPHRHETRSSPRIVMKLRGLHLLREEQQMAHDTGTASTL
jgi:hypothetical protein